MLEHPHRCKWTLGTEVESYSQKILSNAYLTITVCSFIYRLSKFDLWTDLPPQYRILVLMINFFKRWFTKKIWTQTHIVENGYQ